MEVTKCHRKIMNPRSLHDIKRTVDGREYTVKIHFHPDSHETAKEKLKRIMVNDIQNSILEEEILKNS